MSKFQLPDREQSTPEEPKPQVVVVTKDGLLGRILMGLFCSGIVTVVMYFFQFKAWIITILAFIVSLGGQHKVERRDGVEDPAAPVIDRVEKAATKVTSRHPTIPVPAPVAGAGILPVVLPGGIGFKSEPEREADRERARQARLNRLHARADAIGFRYEEDWTVEALDLKVQQAEQRHKEAPERKLLCARADKIEMEVDPAWDLKMFREQVKEGEEYVAMDAEYQAKLREWERAVQQWERDKTQGSNAKCPHCRYLLRVRDPQVDRTLKCPNCRKEFWGRQARAKFKLRPKPEQPGPPQKKKPGFFKRIFS